MPEHKALTVSQFVEAVNIVLEDKIFPHGVMIEGEVSSYRISQGKWVRFSLKDEDAKIECFSTVWRLKTPLEDGMQVRVHGMPKIYPKYGNFSVTVDAVELVGEGALRRAYELLKQKLSEEGVFAPERKRPLPRFPETIGLIASTESAAYGDFMRILGDRWGGVDVLSAHVQVQGKEAVPTILGAFAWFNAHPDAADVLVLTRGGGSLEDLHAFNDEAVVRAVFSSKIPVVVGVGHEPDESLADLAADVRASTPSNAAERVVPDRRDVAKEIGAMAMTIEADMRRAVHERERRLRELEGRLEERLRAARAGFDALFERLRFRFADFTSRVAALSDAVDRDLRLLKSYDPQAVLKRGYGIVRGPGGRVLRDASKVDIGETVRVQLHTGGFSAEVNDTET